MTPQKYEIFSSVRTSVSNYQFYVYMDITISVILLTNNNIEYMYTPRDSSHIWKIESTFLLCHYYNTILSVILMITLLFGILYVYSRVQKSVTPARNFEFIHSEKHKRESGGV
jgi:hypothetical protein